MNWTVAGMTQQDEYFRGPFWVSSPHSPGARPIILGVSDRDDERSDYARLCTKYGQYYQFFLLNEGRNQKMQRRQHQTENTRFD